MLLAKVPGFKSAICIRACCHAKCLVLPLVTKSHTPDQWTLKCKCALCRWFLIPDTDRSLWKEPQQFPTHLQSFLSKRRLPMKQTGSVCKVTMGFHISWGGRLHKLVGQCGICSILQEGMQKPTVLYARSRKGVYPLANYCLSEVMNPRTEVWL